MRHETRDSSHEVRDEGQPRVSCLVSNVSCHVSNNGAAEPLPATIVNGPGVVGELPVIEQTAPPTVTLPISQRRRLVESAVLFITAILFLRTIAVEPFGVPTGSMAPTLYGNHKAAACRRCGYPVKVGEPNNKQNGYPEAQCLNCGAVDVAIPNAPEISGDRLLVDKNVFRLRSPRRWEVAVFICPVDKSKPYVKRIVGLPGEQIQLVDGDVWINGELARKSLAQVRECKVPVFAADFAPPDGWIRRWLPAGTQPIISGETAPLPDWLELAGHDVVLAAESATQPRLAAYWHVDLLELTPQILRDGFEYNGHGTPTHEYPVHDFLLESEIEVLSGSGAVVLQLTDGAETATTYLAAGQDAGASRLHVDAAEPGHTVQLPPLAVGKKYRAAMAFVDRRVSVSIDGAEYFSIDLPPGVKRADVVSPFRIGGQGVRVAFRNVRLFRDIYYRAGDRHASATPFRLGADEYFMLGDNSANSDDSRSWKIPGVPERNFLGKPFLLHQPSRPGQLTVGGKTVHSQSIDWGRIRWLR